MLSRIVSTILAVSLGVGCAAEPETDFIGRTDASNVAAMIVPLVTGDPIHVYSAVRNQMLQEPPVAGALGIFVEEVDGVWREQLPQDPNEDGIWTFQYVVFQSIEEDSTTGYEIVQGEATLTISSDEFVMSGRFDFVDLEQGEFVEAPPDFSTPGGGEMPPGFGSNANATPQNAGVTRPPNYRISGSLSVVYNGVPSASTYTVQVRSVDRNAEDPFADSALAPFTVEIDDSTIPAMIDFTRGFNGAETFSQGTIDTYALAEIY